MIIEYLPGIGLSNHVCLWFNFLCYFSYAQVSRPVYDLHLADFVKMRQLLQYVGTLSCLDIYSVWNLYLLIYKFTDIINDCSPL